MKFRFEKKYVYWGVTAFLVIAASLILSSIWKEIFLYRCVKG